jgi:hypothetical protein
MLARSMELRHLRYFVAAAEEENISRAALGLHVSQPAISRQIRDLEEEISIRLFERSAKALSLTVAGRKFLEEARSVLRHAEEAVARTKSWIETGIGELHVGYAPSPTTQILPRALESVPREESQDTAASLRYFHCGDAPAFEGKEARRSSDRSSFAKTFTRPGLHSDSQLSVVHRFGVKTSTLEVENP